LATTGEAGSLVWIADEGPDPILYVVGPSAEPGGLEVYGREPGCRGPIAMDQRGPVLARNCLLEHELVLQRSTPGGPSRLEPLSTLSHDGPIWAFALGPERASSAGEEGELLIALTGVEDHPLERKDGGFGYIDSFAWVVALSDTGELEPVLELDTSAQGVVTPKWIEWVGSREEPALVIAGYATPDLLRVDFDPGAGEPRVERLPAPAGIRDGVPMAGGGFLAADPLLDRWVRVDAEGYQTLAPAGAELADDRSFEERLGEALAFTTAMAPWNSAEGKRSRFTCETCHFEGRGDGRVHFTGREFEGMKVHASSKPLMGLFPNRPHFSRALDKTMARMVDAEFGVANRHNGRDPWFELDSEELPWLAQLEGWPGSVDGEQLRRALMAFLMRWSMPTNPAARARSSFTPLEAEGARIFARRCEGCHQARLVADDPQTRVALGEGGALGPWERLIFSDSGPLLWASDAYAKTGVRPWVHPEGARVPALRRLYAKWPYFTNGSARSLDELLAQIRVRADPGCELGEGCIHDAGPAPSGAGLSEAERRALSAFLRIL
jgi:hypothetical protein